MVHILSQLSDKMPRAPLAGDSRVGWELGEALKATAEHQSVRGQQDSRQNWEQCMRRAGEHLRKEPQTFCIIPEGRIGLSI